MIKANVFTFGSTFHLFTRNIVFLLKGIDSEIYFPSIRRRDQCQIGYQDAPSSEDPKNPIRKKRAALEGEGTAGMQKNEQKEYPGFGQLLRKNTQYRGHVVRNLRGLAKTAIESKLQSRKKNVP